MLIRISLSLLESAIALKSTRDLSSAIVFRTSATAIIFHHILSAVTLAVVAVVVMVMAIMVMVVSMLMSMILSVMLVV